MSGTRRRSTKDSGRTVRLPPIGDTGLLLVEREGEASSDLSTRKALEIIRKAQEEGRPVWVIIG